MKIGLKIGLSLWIGMLALELQAKQIPLPTEQRYLGIEKKRNGFSVQQVVTLMFTHEQVLVVEVESEGVPDLFAIRATASVDAAVVDFPQKVVPHLGIQMDQVTTVLADSLRSDIAAQKNSHLAVLRMPGEDHFAIVDMESARKLPKQCLRADLKTASEVCGPMVSIPFAN